MDLGMIKVLGHSGWNAGFKLGDSLIVHNRDVNCEIVFYITHESLEYWSAKNLKSFGGNTNVALAQFYE